MNNTEVEKRLVFEMGIADDGFSFTSSIEAALISTETELKRLEDTIKSVENIRPDCDKLDYTLAACSGALCGIIDIFLVGKPGESPATNITDEWVENRVTDFAKRCGWNGKGDTVSAIRHLEKKKFMIPYDQTGIGDAGKDVFGLNPSNHHFKSLGHNPTLLGLFYSILDQFTNQSHFVSGGQLIALMDANDEFLLRGDSFLEKIFYGFYNWFRHLISDVSGSSSSKGRGMGIPSPFWSWTNNIIAIKRELKIPVSEFDKTINDLALSIYEKGYDIRFQATQAIPVIINELVVRLMYSIRRFVKYLVTTDKADRSLSAIWNACEPFSNPTVKRMLTVAHGTFCILDIGDATIRAFKASSSTFNVEELFLRLNIVGVGRFAISLYGEAKRAVAVRTVESEAQFSRRETVIVENYLDGLALLSELYNDKKLMDFIDDFRSSDLYIQAFRKSVRLAELRKVPADKILRTKSDIDSYFGGDQR